jgi:glucose uptake protein GlcU
MMETMKTAAASVGAPVGELARTVASGTSGLAQRVGSSVASATRRIGPKRLVIGLAALGVIVGGAILVARYMRSDDETDDAEDHANAVAHSRHKQSRAERKRARAAMAH